MPSSKYEIKMVVVNKREEIGILVSMIGCDLNTPQLVADLGILQLRRQGEISNGI